MFTNTSISDPNESYYSWKFGDGNYSYQRHPKHVYDSARSYAVLLKVVMKNGCSDSIVKNINIKLLPATCDFDIVPDSGTSSNAYKFIPKGGTMAGNSYTWLTGDGTTLTSTADTNYSYSLTKKYCVTMIARNASGCECSKTRCFNAIADINTAASLSKLIAISPNPTHGVFNVKLEADVCNSMLIEIYNSIGQRVKTVTADSNYAIIDLSTYTNGIYIIKVIADNQFATKQILFE